MFTNVAVLAAQWIHTINSMVQSTLLPNFQNPNTGPFWLFGLNPGISNLATLNDLSSAHRPIRATAGERYSSYDKISQKMHSPLKSVHGLPWDILALWSKNDVILMRKSWCLEILEIIKESFEDHFLELLEAPGSSSTSLISRNPQISHQRKKIIWRHQWPTFDLIFSNFAVLAAQWTNIIHSMVQSTLLPNFQNPNTGPFWNSGPNPENEKLATLNLLASATRPVSARARNTYSGIAPK